MSNYWTSPLYLWCSTAACTGNYLLSGDESDEWEKLSNCEKNGVSCHKSRESRPEMICHWNNGDRANWPELSDTDRRVRTGRTQGDVKTNTNINLREAFWPHPAFNGLWRNVFIRLAKSGDSESIGAASDCGTRNRVYLESRSLWLLVNLTSITLLTVWLHGPLSPPAKWDWCPWLHTSERAQLEV